MADELSFTADELTERSGVSLRTLRYYIAEGLIAGPGTRGKGARYGQEHLLRLLAIRRLAAEHLPLNVIRERLSNLSPVELAALAETAPSSVGIVPAGPRAFIVQLLQSPAVVRRERPADVWRRHAPVSGVEVHVRADVEERYRDRIARALRTLAGGS